MSDLSCFKAYDIRGEIGVNIDEGIAYRIGRAVAQHFGAQSVVIGFDARETSPAFAVAAARGAMDAGADVLDIGMAGTEEMYWAVTEFGACAGIEVTASHNPINYNGMKIVKSASQPLDDAADFQVIKALAGSQEWLIGAEIGKELDRSAEARRAYVDRVLSFVDIKALRPLKIVVNSGNGAAGPTFDAIAERLMELGAPLDFIRVHHVPDATFPNGIPNPLLPENHAATADVVKAEGADLGVAFDGDFDRCFFFDEAGQFVPGEYVVGLLASIFLEKEVGAKIVHDPRVIWNTQDIVTRKGGIAVQSKTGHAFIKQTMRSHEAAYGGEMSAHHYFRDFAYCDSGMIPWLLIAELVSRSGRSLGDWVKDRFAAFPSSGEMNFQVDHAGAAIKKVLSAYRADARSLDETDGVSLAFEDWRFNLRRSNTEPLVRLNVEGKGTADALNGYVITIADVLGGARG
ncbi:Phosphomannomutase/phosphoglucomutase [Rhodobacteraceae bacterium SB2]|nr:Phosphomannomutase/phosphoglucomutase [Rhodobacteraceae bacterium SB2]